MTGLPRAEACPECGDSARTCEHRCFACDKICPAGTCSNGYCEWCCADRCED